jgi:muramidase (phage lysozyme)
VNQDDIDLLGRTNAQIDPNTTTGHPYIYVDWATGHQLTSAYGRYQITIDTANSRHLADFTPMGQEADATKLMQIRKMIDPLLNGDPMRAILNGNREWASLPESPYGQPTMTRAAAMQTYQSSYSACMAGW